MFYTSLRELPKFGHIHFVSKASKNTKPHATHQLAHPLLELERNP